MPTPDKKILSENDAVMDDFTGQFLRWAGAALIFLVGGAHLLIAGEHFLAATYLGILFLANFTGAAAAAFALYWSPRAWGWLLGSLVAGGAFFGFVVSRLFGLPGAPEFEGQWLSIAGLLTLMVEGAFLTLALLAVTPQGRSLLRAEQRRVEREEFPPAVQETPAHFEHIEQEMAEIRSRTAPEIVDLRRHVEPQMVTDQARQGALEYLRSLRRAALASAPESRQPGPLAAIAVLFALVVLVWRRMGGRDE